MKNYLKTILIITLSLIAFNATAQTKNFIDQNYIEVTGTVEKELIPDEIYVSITINESNLKKNETLETKEKQMIDTLKNLKINIEENLSIQDFMGNYQKFFLAKNKVVKQKNYQLLLHDSNKLSDVFKDLDKMLISLKIDKVSHSKIEEETLKIRVEALKIAKKKAQNYANAIDQQIGKALFIQENQQTSHLLFNQSTNVNYKSSYNDSSSLSFKTITIKASVLAKFELK